MRSSVPAAAPDRDHTPVRSDRHHGSPPRSWCTMIRTSGRRTPRVPLAAGMTIAPALVGATVSTASVL